MKPFLPVRNCILTLLLLAGAPLMAQQPQLPTNYPPGQYDESKVPGYTLPDPLLKLDGGKVSDAKTWKEKRRPEILRLFETNVYGRTMVGRQKEMTWEVTSPDTNTLDGAATTRTVTIYFVGKTNGPKMDLRITLPSKIKKPVPIFLMAGGGGPPGRPGGQGDQASRTLVSRGYGLATCNLGMVEPDRRDGYTNSIRKFFAPSDQPGLGPDEWGAIGAWAWAMSRAMDYLMTDSAMDPYKISVIGVSRYGKVAMWAGAQDERFAIVFSSVSGCGGATIVRRQYGETIANITGFASYWFAPNFKNYAQRVNDLPVDWHMLIACVAPRPIYIATAEQDYWNDPRGQFIAATNATSVYQLFGKTGLGTGDMPKVDSPVGDTIRYHMRTGGHGLNNYDWEQFLDFADRQFGNSAALK